MCLIRQCLATREREKIINNHLLYLLLWDGKWDGMGRLCPWVQIKAGTEQDTHPTTAIVFFLQQKPFLPERQGLIDSTKGQDLAVPCKAGTSLL